MARMDAEEKSAHEYWTDVADTIGFQLAGFNLLGSAAFIRKRGVPGSSLLDLSREDAEHLVATISEATNQRIRDLEAQVAVLREALEFYAERKHWEAREPYMVSAADADIGSVARAALSSAPVTVEQSDVFGMPLCIASADELRRAVCEGKCIMSISGGDGITAYQYDGKLYIVAMSDAACIGEGHD